MALRQEPRPGGKKSLRRIATGGPISIRTGQAILSTEPETAAAACICRKIADGTLLGYVCECSEAKRKRQMGSHKIFSFRAMNVTERELDAHQRRQRVDAVLAACASDGERIMVAHMTITHRDFAADRFARRHAEHAVAAHAAVPARALIASAHSIARSAGECDEITDGYRKLRTAISHVASAATGQAGVT
jgi:hypothetical protein